MARAALLNRPTGRRQEKFNPYVHGARGMFAFLVFVFHVAHSNVPTFSWATDSYVRAGVMALQYGVELFFGISGIVIIGALNRSPTLFAFAWDRATRIFPVLWVTILTISLLTVANGSSSVAKSQLDWFFNLFPVTPFVRYNVINPPAWSLAYEIFFYGAAMLAWRYRDWPGTRRANWFFGLLFIILMPRAILMLPGVLIALQMLNKGFLRKISGAPGVTLLLFFACWRLVPSIQWLSLSETNILGPLYIPFSAWLRGLPLMILGGFFGSLTLIGIYEGRGLLSRLLNTAPMLWLGTVSYSFYLWHPMVLAIVKRGPGISKLMEISGSAAQLVLFLVALPSVLFVSWLSQRLIEVRFTRWIRQYGPQKSPGPVV